MRLERRSRKVDGLSQAVYRHQLPMGVPAPADVSEHASLGPQSHRAQKSKLKAPSVCLQRGNVFSPNSISTKDLSSKPKNERYKRI
ncbi:hypothetical protein PoB_005731100 [Plakobranchus ocellatus]|uniref:Uncharacterized protein n=1 Tax=Plakobranchus ocellatus TaxID=259542 RepID=A0AAV4C659_9GAST|nr:hypothetical protein PoB_005731100 [Plakobranchus ocellatus]